MRSLVFCLAVCLFVSCNVKKEQEETETAGAEYLIDPEYSGTCPHLFAPGTGSAVLSWVRQLPDGSAALCYSVAGNGVDFGPTVVVPGSSTVKAHGENPPKVVVAPDGSILAAWGVANPGPRNPYSGLVYYSVSLDNGQNWTNPARISLDPESIDQRYFDLEILPDGTIGAVWLDNRSGTELEGSGLYFARLGGDHFFEGEQRIDSTTCQCCRTDLFADNNGDLHIAYRKILNGSVRDMVHVVSTDNGNQFSSPRRISIDNWEINGCPHTGPAIAQNDDGLSFVWYTMGGGNGIFHASSADNGKTFLPKAYVSDNPSAKHPQITTLKNGRLATAWDEKTTDGNRIAIEVRSGGAEPAPVHTRYLTDKRSDASYPVLVPVANRLLVAYPVKKDRAKKAEKIAYQLVDPI